jgi:hypothetical protein
MSEPRTFTLTGRYGISKAQIETVIDLLLTQFIRDDRHPIQHHRILVLSPNLEIAERACIEISSRVKGLFPEPYVMRHRSIHHRYVDSGVWFFAHTQDPCVLRGFQFTRCLVTGIENRKRAQMFEQEYFACNYPLEQ